VLALQELLAPNDWLLRPALRAYHAVYGVPTGRRFIGPRNPLFFAHSALTVVDSGSFYLGSRPERFAADWGARQVRGATWSRLRYRGRPLLVLNTHLDHQSERARGESTELILRRLSSLGWPQTPAILCGDFNAAPSGHEHARLLEAGFRDAWSESGQADLPTFHGFRGAAARDEQRIDWLLHSPELRALRAERITAAEPPRYPSDHYPVMADFVWASDGSA
jgi:endonuclease/exonuclease/phosphatase family metal-dependent hydrolase